MLPQNSKPNSPSFRWPAPQDAPVSLGRTFGDAMHTLGTRSLKGAGRSSSDLSSAQVSQSVRPAPGTRRTLLTTSGRIGANQTLQGSLSRSDRSNPLRAGRHADEYTLAGVRPGNWVMVTALSQNLDTYLQVLDGRTGQLLWENDDLAPGNQQSRLGFVVKAGTTYRVRVTSYETNQTGNYTLTTRTLPTSFPSDYNTNYGFGLIDAGAAVARAIGQSNFEEVGDYGGALWNLDMVRAPEVWARGYTGKDVVVAVIDTGLDITHPDLATNLWTNSREIADNAIDDDQNGLVDDIHGWNFFGNNSEIGDGDGHGTHVAGTIAALSNDIGIIGVAPDAKIMPLKVLDDENSTSGQFDSHVALAIQYATRNGARVINMSIGDSVGTMPLTRRALREARRAGVVAVMAAGNSGQEGMVRPDMPAFHAASGLGIAVGAVDRGQILTDFSSPGGNRPMPFFSAPGASVRSTINEGKFAVLSGTSMASPHIAGVVALMQGANPALTPPEIERILMETARFDDVIID